MPMEWLGVIGLIALAFVLPFLPYPARVKRLEAKVKKLERKQKGENTMSRLITELTGKTCVMKSDAFLQLAGSERISCEVLDTDDEWVKLRYTDKKNREVVKLLRIEKIDEIEISETK